MTMIDIALFGPIRIQARLALIDLVPSYQDVQLHRQNLLNPECRSKLQHPCRKSWYSCNVSYGNCTSDVVLAPSEWTTK